MSSFIITNEGTKNLKGRLSELIQNSKELKFLVGFFYFSGIRELYESLKDMPNIQVDVLVGLNVDRAVHGIVEYGDQTKNLTDRERFTRFLESVSRSINSNDFDTEDFYTQIKYFLHLIKDGRLRIRKTYNPNHAKLYIFKIKDDIKHLKEAFFITGSSNLTRAGLMSQEEFNVEISDHGVGDAEDYFKQLWEEAVRITENDEFKRQLIDLIERKTLVAGITPFEAYALVLKNYLDSISQKQLRKSIPELLSKKGYQPYKYQLDAVSQALTIIENYNGVIVSDVVGLGKSIIAGMIGRSLNKRGIIICPPGLIGDPNKKSGWEKYKEDFELYDWEIRSLGIPSLKHTLKLVQESDEYEVVIVDEAHRFRNQDTEAYELLSNICRNKIVILLTATPFNNSPADIFSLLKLFVIPGRSKITLDNHLDTKFKVYNNEFDKLSYIRKNHSSANPQKRGKALAFYESLFESKSVELNEVQRRAKYLANSIRSVIEPVLIRRNRIDLKQDPEYSKEVYELSQVDDPKELFFELTKEQANFYDRVINKYFGEEGEFRGAIYRPFVYEEGIKPEDQKRVLGLEKNFEFQSQSQLYDFMRRLVVKRFESSFGAFRQTIMNLEMVTEKMQQFIKNSDGKFILDRKLIEKIYEEELDVIEEEIIKFEQKLGEGNYPKSYKVYDVNSFKEKQRFYADIEADLKLYRKVRDELEDLKLVDNDPKLAGLITEIRNILNADHPLSEPERKVVVFTEYTDTATYLEDELEKHFPEQLLTVGKSLPASRINEILMNFDASYHEQENKYRVLLATDKISEGFNLNRAGAIINYDIPWNPTRVIQRVGRINRISKKVFERLHIYNFFPTIQGSDIVKSRQIAADKMFLIHNTLGEDSKVFESDEKPTAAKLFTKIMRNPEAHEEASFQTKIRQKYFELEKSAPDIIGRVATLPSRVKVAKRYEADNLLVFIKKGLGFFVRGIVKEDVVEEMLFEEVIHHIECSKEERAVQLSERFWGSYEAVKEYKDKTKIASSELSLEKKALNNLKSLQGDPSPDLELLLPFIRDLVEDLLDYKTLPDYTLRRIAKLDTQTRVPEKRLKMIRELQGVQSQLGVGFMEITKRRLGELQNEVIIAIENVTHYEQR
ncbi:MAG: DEAD/DEAH box helicase family protein [Candidatus Andersenbacteria bacterium]|nr:DEAD/DEAH box helicase family protein [Candidatus Andersenbacteria bacterium]MBI3251199.1 DEAD/DEAH box helicase family protein [Candidatus Andersenbacteria bacterium]